MGTWESIHLDLRCCEHCNETSGSVKETELLRAERLSTSQEALCSMELVLVFC